MAWQSRRIADLARPEVIDALSNFDEHMLIRRFSPSLRRRHDSRLPLQRRRPQLKPMSYGLLLAP